MAVQPYCMLVVDAGRAAVYYQHTSPMWVTGIGGITRSDFKFLETACENMLRITSHVKNVTKGTSDLKDLDSGYTSMQISYWLATTSLRHAASSARRSSRSSVAPAWPAPST